MTEVVIKRLGHHGDGIADGPIYVPQTLPGEQVTGELDGDKLVDTRVLHPSGDRVKPPCRHYKTCGGCQLQHASDAFLADWKQDVVRSALTAQGLSVVFHLLHVAPAGSRRRAVFSARRTKKGALVGFHAKASDVIIDTPDCILLAPELIAARPAVEALAMTGASRKHALSALVTRSLAGIDVHVRGGKPLDGPLQVQLAAIAEAHDLARLSWEDEVIVTRRAPRQRFGTAFVVPPPGAFLQATEPSETALLADVAGIMQGAKHIADLFSGCGTFALPLARASKVHAVEGDAAMVDALDHGWRHAEGLRAVTTEARDLFRRPLDADELRQFDGVVIDPPRAGAEAQVAEIARSEVGLLAYVSCNPVTFARDAKTLCDAGFRLASLRVVDQFRWSAHIELVASFMR